MESDATVSSVNADALVNQYINMWNEGDAVRRLAIAREILDDVAVYRDPVMTGEGTVGISAMIAGAQQQFAGLGFSLCGKVDVTGNCVRFSWSLGPANGASVVAGTDFAELSGGRFIRLTGFIDQAPGDPAPAA